MYKFLIIYILPEPSCEPTNRSINRLYCSGLKLHFELRQVSRLLSVFFGLSKLIDCGLEHRSISGRYPDRDNTELFKAACCIKIEKK